MNEISDICKSNMVDSLKSGDAASMNQIVTVCSSVINEIKSSEDIQDTKVKVKYKVFVNIVSKQTLFRRLTSNTHKIS